MSYTHRSPEIKKAKGLFHSSYSWSMLFVLYVSQLPILKNKGQLW